MFDGDPVRANHPIISNASAGHHALVVVAVHCTPYVVLERSRSTASFVTFPWCLLSPRFARVEKKKVGPPIRPAISRQAKRAVLFVRMIETVVPEDMWAPPLTRYVGLPLTLGVRLGSPPNLPFDSAGQRLVITDLR